MELLQDGVSVESLPWMAPKSVLNQLRRDAVRLLLEQRTAASRHEIADRDALNVIRDQTRERFCGETVDPSSMSPALCVLVRAPGQLEAVLDWNASSGGRLAVVYVDVPVLGEYSKAVAMCKDAHVPVGVATPRICKPGDEGIVIRLADLAPDCILVRNLAVLSVLRGQRPDLPLIGDHSLNAANEITADVLASLGLSRITASYDLNIGQLASLRCQASHLPLEVVIHQHVPMFHMAHCVTASHLSEGNDCRSCGAPYRGHTVQLRDRKGIDHLMLHDATGRSTVYTGRVQTAAELQPALRALNIGHWRVEMLDERPEDVRQLVDLYSGWIGGTVTPDALVRHLKARNPAGVTRGTLDFA